MEVEWFDVVEFPQHYELNRYGQVRRKNNRGKPGEPLTLSKETFPRVTMYINGKAKHRAIHIMLAQRFIPRVPGKTKVNHKNGIQQNYSLDNLEWVTSAENTNHADATGLRSSVRSGTTIEELSKNGEIIKTFSSIQLVANQVGFSRPGVAYRLKNLSDKDGVAQFGNRFFRIQKEEIIAGESWVPFNTGIKLIDTRYSISNMGRVRINKSGKLKKTRLGSDGRYYINVTADKKGYCLILARAIFYAFNKNADRSKQIDHIDKNETNNLLSNLQALTTIEHNVKDHGIPILGHNPDTDEIIVFKSGACAKREFDFKWFNITNAINRGIKCNGFYWMHLDTDEAREFLMLHNMEVIKNEESNLILQKMDSILEDDEE